MTRPHPPLRAFQSTEWRQTILSGARNFGIHISDTRMEKIVRFAQMLMEWNRRINLTAITDPREVAVKHFLDAMAALPFLPKTGRLLDIGSGGGFPGLVLAVFRPTLLITSVDSVRKKISFQQQVIRTLEIGSATALHTRAEALPEKEDRYDIIVSRALGSLELFTTLGLPVLAEGGKMIAYKGGMEDGAGDSLESLKSRHPGLAIDIHSYLLPSLGDQRSLVFIGRKHFVK